MLKVVFVTLKALLISGTVYAFCVWLLPPWPTLIYFEAICWFVGFRLLLRRGLQQIADQRGLGIGNGLESSPDRHRYLPHSRL